MSDSGGWHELTEQGVLEALDASGDGLSLEEAAERLERHGPNEVPTRPGEGVFELLRRQIAQPLIYVLLAAALVTALLGLWVDVFVILGVVIANATIGFTQEYRAGRAIAALARLASDTASVVRDGRRRTVDTTEVVPGDVVLLEAGSKLPADCRLLAAAGGLQTDEAMLTGESVPVDKAPSEQGIDPDTDLPDRHNMAFGGTLVTAGHGRAVVVATGADTELARISELISSAEILETPLTRKIAAFSKTITGVILLVAGITVAVALLRGFEAVDAFLAGVALAVAAIPEGLPAFVTIALAVGVRRMAHRRSLVRHLPAVETLGSTTVICSDKTGTLTRGEMVLTEIFAGESVSITGEGYEPDGAFVRNGGELDSAPEWVGRALEAAALCTEAHLVEREGETKVDGDPMEGALLAAAGKAGIDKSEAEERRPRTGHLPFESERKFMATVHDGAEGELTILKGAPEALAERCSAVAWDEAVDPEAIHDHAEEMASRGLRVLGVASRPGGARPEDDEGLGEGFTLLALLGLMDPPREEARRAVSACQSAGIRVVMITGDHPRTAEAVAEKIGIEVGHPPVAGRDLEGADEAALQEIADRAAVFARVSPEHKLHLVRALQHQGEIVAMTGDGVNDAAALRQADIGIAMGKAGTEVAKQASDMVLQDDNFATIEAAVEEGRHVYDNLIKGIAFILPTSAGQSLLILGAIALGLTLPVLPVQVLWVNLVVAVALALPLAMEATEHDVMERTPRRPNEPVLGGFVVQRIFLVATLMFLAAVAVFEIEQARDADLDTARTAVVGVVMAIQALYLFSCRSLRTPIRRLGFFSNPHIFGGIAGVIVLQAAFTYLPAMNTLFGTAPLDLRQWGLIAAFAAATVPVIALHTRFARRRWAA